MNKKNKFLLFFFSILLFINILIILTNVWIFDNFGNVKIQEILFTLLSPTSGTDSSVVYSYLLKVLLIAVLFTVISCFIVLYTRKKSKYFKYIKNVGAFLLLYLYFYHVYILTPDTIFIAI